MATMMRRSFFFRRRRDAHQDDSSSDATTNSRTNEKKKKLLSRGHCWKLRERDGGYSGKAPYCFINHLHDSGLCSSCREIDMDRPQQQHGDHNKCRLRLEKHQIYLCQVELGVAMMNKGERCHDGVAHNWMHAH
eukprot:CAMPEP_0116014886 /NCGR_PEP_ID=MMETSP0321-20121206/6518_1 /TAXON_ID=163516 /ORGANISM="Leptocylindrus danicus var. danicus, Strain B650" /LENGTH=133 /DNA_ID=CAMNT_0003484571 /DNA_START=313 /DNA_END=714 /DNA_ORIENTATION=-